MDVAGKETRRRFQWTSSVAGQRAALEKLNRDMADFYAGHSTRQHYQAMVDAADNTQPETERALGAAIQARRPRAILEVGCGSGRIYRQLRADGFSGSYTGLEMSPDVVSRNQDAHPEAVWLCGSIYDTHLPAASFDVVFAYFVLEHCVYPADALQRMLDLVSVGGVLILVFPDFVEMGRLASQTLGFVDGRAGQRLAQGDLLNALVNLYEARVRLPRALKQVVKNHGPFPVNLQPRCLNHPDETEPDADAVYISSKSEVKTWAEARGLIVSFPAGVDGHFSVNALIQIERTSANPRGDA